LTGLEQGFTESARKKIEYTGFDRKDEYLRETEKIAASCGLRSYRTVVGALASVSNLLPAAIYNFVTLINAVHEIDPNQFASVLIDSILRLTPNGVLYIYDMESIVPPELGALSWKASELREICVTLTEALQVSSYDPSPNRWQHSSRNGWSLVIQREHLGTPENLGTLRNSAVKAIDLKIHELLQSKYSLCESALESLTNYSSETAEEQTLKQDLLHEFWALRRALEGR
jgi:hypothetical protein